MITIESLTVSKGGQGILSVRELRVQAGERVAIVGTNGSGKTTLMRVLAGLERDYAGLCRIDVPIEQRVLVHQQPYLFRGTVLFNVMYGLRARGESQRAARAVALKWIERFQLSELAGRRVGTLSGGERRRVALARSAAIEPQLLLLDEPLADLDERGTEAVSQLVLSSPSVTVVMATPVAAHAELATRTEHLKANMTAKR